MQEQHAAAPAVAQPPPSQLAPVAAPDQPALPAFAHTIAQASQSLQQTITDQVAVIMSQVQAAAASEVVALKKELAARDAQNDNLKGELCDKRAICTSIEKDLSAAEQKLLKKRKRIQELEKEVASWSALAKKRATQYAGAQSKLAARDREVQKLKAEVDKLSDKAVHWEAVAMIQVKHSKDVKAELAARDGELRSLKAELEARTKEAANLRNVCRQFAQTVEKV